jgi:phosphate transport system protein
MTTYIKRHIHREIETLKTMLLELSALVEDNLLKAVNSIKKEDLELAKYVIDKDEKIDTMEVELEEECLKILALYQPVASDLRFIISILKINNDLERIGDLAVNIAEKVERLRGIDEKSIISDILTMAHESRSMVKKSLDAFVNLDTNLAKEICASDDVIDNMNRQNFFLIRDIILQKPDDQTEKLLRLLAVSRDLERVGDHATNIAEGVIYMIEGEIIRHKIKSK